MKITVLSLACCNPVFAPQDQLYVSRIREALNRLGLDADVDIAYGTDVYLGKDRQILEQISPVFNKHGMAAAPAMLIDKKLVLYGGVPSVEKLMESIKTKAEQGSPLTI